MLQFWKMAMRNNFGIRCVALCFHFPSGVALCFHFPSGFPHPISLCPFPPHLNLNVREATAPKRHLDAKSCVQFLRK